METGVEKPFTGGSRSFLISLIKRLVMKRIYNILLSLFAVLSMTACGDDISNSAEGLDRSFAVSKSEVTFAKSGGLIDLYVRAASKPAASSDADWATVSEESSESAFTHKYALKVAQNTSYDDRTGTITFTVGGESKTVTVTQTATDGLIIETATFNVDAAGGDITVKLKSNGKYAYRSDVAWITENTTRASMQEYSHSFHVGYNPTVETRTGSITFTMGDISESVTVSQAANANAVITTSATDIAKEMYPGWNLGNTMEASFTAASGGLSAETSWQSTKTSQAIIDYVKSLGFKSVRIPCSWYTHFDSGTTTINTEWMARIKEIVDYCIQDGLYVVLNDHWDSGWLEVDGFTKSRSSYQAVDEATITAKADTLKIIWAQIANQFKGYGDHLLFAGLNEPFQEYNLFSTRHAELTPILERYEQAFVDAVRATGGNNAKRTLVVQGPSTNMSSTVSSAVNFTMPDDATAGSGHLMVEVHYYEPWSFCNGDTDAWGTTSEVDYMKKLFASMKAKFADKGIPAIIGEYGANWQKNETAHNRCIQAYYEDINEFGPENGLIPFVWDTNTASLPSMTIINRNALSIFCTPAFEGITKGVANTTWMK